jgi:hypothetical protein
MVISCTAYGLAPLATPETPSTSAPLNEEVQIGQPLDINPEKSTSLKPAEKQVCNEAAPAPSETKKCNGCGENKSLEKFKTNGGKPDGTKYRMATCRDCMDKKKYDKKFQGSVSSVVSASSLANIKREPTKNDIMLQASKGLSMLVDLYHPDNDEIKRMKIQIIDKAVGISSKAVNVISEI